VPFSDLLQQLDRGAVTEVVVGGDTLEFRVTAKDLHTVAPANYVTLNAAFIRTSPGRTSASTSAQPPSRRRVRYGALILGIGFIAILGLTLYRVDRPHPRARKQDARGRSSASTITFNDVAGVDEAKEEVKEVVGFLEPGRFSAIGSRIPKGVLLVRPLGTGKTLLAKSIDERMPFLFASGSDFVEMYAGVGASRIRKLFRDARRHPSCIIFIDDRRGQPRPRRLSLSHEGVSRTNQLLVEMDGFAPNQGVVVIAATSRADILDRRCCIPATSIVR
jgi:cell division protease FtsH